ncbi:MAG: RDD family protein, partial [Neisseriaceae bacterium]|nr:RDD family protein [Neisseriaceae bacterium]
MNNAEHFIDTISSVISPEAVEIELRPAGVWVRSRAFLLDFVIRIGLALGALFLMLWILPLTKGFSIGLYFIVIFIIYWLYPVLFEVFWHGQTPAKRVFGLRVVQDNGTPISFTQSLIRNLMRTADMLPMYYGLGMSVMLMHPQFKRLGDILSGSLVIYTDEPKIKIN